jgi:ABC-type polysaccharide/polyol phosphate export permease
MVSYFRGIWACRFFWFSLVRMDLRTRYRRSVLGIGWSLLHPIAMTVILSTAFCTIFQLDWRDFAPYILAGLAVWNYITSSTLMGCQSFFQNESYIRQCPLPLAIYPLRSVLSNSFHFIISLMMVIAFVGIIHGLNVPVLILNLVPTLMLLFVVVWSMAVLAGLANVYFQDTQHLAEVGFQILFYMAPLIYPEKVARRPELAWVINLNPFVPFVYLVRDPILYGTTPDAHMYLRAAITAFGLAWLASFAMSRLQKKLIFQL